MAIFVSLQQGARDRLATLARSAYAAIPQPWERHFPQLVVICTSGSVGLTIDLRSGAARREKALRGLPAILGGQVAEDPHDASKVAVGFYGDEEYLIYLADVTEDGARPTDEEIQEQFLQECAVALLRNVSIWGEVPPSFIDGRERLVGLCEAVLRCFPRFCLGTDLSDKATPRTIATFNKLNEVVLASGGPCLQ